MRLRAYKQLLCLHLPSHSRLLQLAECETQIQQQYCSQTNRLMVTTVSLSYSHAVSTCYSNVSSMLSYFTIVLAMCRLATCAGAISANSESMKTNSTMLDLVTTLKMIMVVGVLVLQIVLPNSYSTIPGTLRVKGQCCSANASCHLLESQELVLLFRLLWM